MYKHFYWDFPFSQIPEWDLVGAAEYTDSVYEDGVREAILAATWEGEYHLVAGNRRILSLKAAHERAEADGTLADRPWLNVLPALIYEDMPPDVQAAWAIKDNEERSDNPLHLYTVIKAAQARGDWDLIYKMTKLNPARYKQALEYDRLTPELMQAVLENRMTKTNALAAARLGARQDMLVKMAQARAKDTGKPVVITGGDIKAAKQARASAVLSALGGNLVPKQEEVAQIVERPMFLIANNELVEELTSNGVLFRNFREAFEEAQAKGASLYRLVEVS